MLWLFGKLELWLLCFEKLEDSASRVSEHIGNREKLDRRAQLEVGRVFVLQVTGRCVICHSTSFFQAAGS